jgi:hypothetical protein
MWVKILYFYTEGERDKARAKKKNITEKVKNKT